MITTRQLKKQGIELAADAMERLERAIKTIGKAKLTHRLKPKKAKVPGRARPF